MAPEEYLSAVPEPLPSVAGQPTVTLTIGESVAAVRRAVNAAAIAGAWLARDRLGDLLAALSEVVTNSLMHGKGERMLSVWTHDGAAVGAVTDQGEGPVDPLAGYRPPSDHASGGMGLWITRQVCDAVSMENIDGVTRVRLAIN
jgi:anti-sigma regulatory factor (Ser/Thr protein kinase)